MVWILGKRLMHIIALTLLASCGEVSLGWARRRVGGGRVAGYSTGLCSSQGSYTLLFHARS